MSKDEQSYSLVTLEAVRVSGPLCLKQNLSFCCFYLP